MGNKSQILGSSNKLPTAQLQTSAVNQREDTSEENHWSYKEVMV